MVSRIYILQEPNDIEQKAENDEDSNETFKNSVQIQLDNKSSLEFFDNYEKPSEIHEKPSIEVSKESSCDDCNKVRNIWFLSPVAPSKREKNRLVLFSLYIF